MTACRRGACGRFRGEKRPGRLRRLCCRARAPVASSPGARACTWPGRPSARHMRGADAAVTEGLHVAGQDRTRRPRSSKRETGPADRASFALSACRSGTSSGSPRLPGRRHRRLRAGLLCAGGADDGFGHALECVVAVAEGAKRPPQRGDGLPGDRAAPGCPGSRPVHGPRWRGRHVVPTSRAVGPRAAARLLPGSR